MVHDFKKIMALFIQSFHLPSYSNFSLNQLILHMQNRSNRNHFTSPSFISLTQHPVTGWLLFYSYLVNITHAKYEWIQTLHFYSFYFTASVSVRTVSTLCISGYPLSISAYINPVKQSLINQKPEGLMNNISYILYN